MNISEIKAKLGVQTLPMETTTKDGEITDWLRVWNNEKREAIVIHKDLFDEIKADPTGVTTLFLKEPKVGKTDKGEHITHVIAKGADVYGTI